MVRIFLYDFIKKEELFFCAACSISFLPHILVTWLVALRAITYLLITIFYKTVPINVILERGFFMNTILLMLFLTIQCPLVATYNYRFACKEDLSELLRLQKRAEADAQKLVLLPEKYRPDALMSAINKKMLFVVEHGEALVGFKKLYLVNDSEKQSLLHDEIRCVGEQARCVFNGAIDMQGAFFETVDPIVFDMHRTPIIYNGADYTEPEHRGHGVNQILTNSALSLIASQVAAAMQKNKADEVTMVYGLTESNAGEVGSRLDRTRGICKSFRQFMVSHAQARASDPVLYARYRAFKPTITEGSDGNLQVSSDADSVPGFGCVLSMKGLSS